MLTYYALVYSRFICNSSISRKKLKKEEESKLAKDCVLFEWYHILSPFYKIVYHSNPARDI